MKRSFATATQPFLATLPSNSIKDSVTKYAGRYTATLVPGDGIGPEIMAATLNIMEAAGANLAIDTIEIGEKVYQKGQLAGIEPSAWESLRTNKIFLKAPINGDYN